MFKIIPKNASKQKIKVLGTGVEPDTNNLFFFFRADLGMGHQP